MIRYRTGMDRTTGRLLTGWDHVQQSVGVILSTHLEARVMRLAFGSDLIRHIGKNLTEARVLNIYRSVVRSVHPWEPEYRIRTVSLVELERTGGLSLATKGLYFPEGRLGNFDIVETAEGAWPLAKIAGGFA